MRAPAANAERLEPHFLPGYSPQLDSDEQVWDHLEHHSVSKRSGIHVVEQLRRIVHEHLGRMAAAPKLIRAFFEERFCRYAKA